MNNSELQAGSGSVQGNALQAMLAAQDIQPGESPSYQLCKTIAAYHPLGAKMSDSPISMAQSQQRKISIPAGPEERLKEAFNEEWKALGADRHIFNVARQARIYGVASIALLVQGAPPDRPISYETLFDSHIAFNVFDPLNTSGSLVLSQQPNDMDFQKVKGIAVQGVSYHPSRSVTMMNENPLYIEYTTSSFGYVGRSVYQRPLYPLKSFLQTMITDDMVSLKSGVLIAKQKQPGSIINAAMSAVASVKRAIVKEAINNNVISIGVDEDIESLNLQNIDGAFGMARKDILENIAVAADMPAKLLNQETFAEGFGEGSEDAKHVSQYIDRIRIWMEPLYTFFDKICMYRAWNENFFETIKNEFPEEYGRLTYKQAFYRWKNSFTAAWPNLLEEPDSEKIKVSDVQLKAIIAAVEVMAPLLDPENKATLIEWACDNFNAQKLLFGSPLVIDMDALKEYDPMEAMGGEEGLQPQKPPPAFSARDSSRVKDALNELGGSVARLPDLAARRRELAERIRAHAK